MNPWTNGPNCKSQIWIGLIEHGNTDLRSQVRPPRFMTNLPPTSDGPSSRRRLSLGGMLAIMAMIAANLALASQVVKVGGWRLAGIIVGTNAVFCTLAGLVVRLRLVPLMALFTTAELTEALLWQSATSGRSSDWIATVAVLGAVALLALALGINAAHRARSRMRRP